VATPFARDPRLEEALGSDAEIWIKDETSNVAGSHKGRHLFGVLLWIEVARRTGLAPNDERPRLAIASCGNAALAAAVLAKAAGYELEVFVPPHAGAEILDRLASLDARLVTCPRAGAVPGDPCVLRFREAVAAGKALPFTCQGNANGLAIEGGETLAYEIVSARLSDGGALDRLFVQVGGGALASACAQCLARANEMALLARMPRLDVVQTRGGHHLVRAWERMRPGSARLSTPPRSTKRSSGRRRIGASSCGRGRRSREGGPRLLDAQRRTARGSARHGRNGRLRRPRGGRSPSGYGNRTRSTGSPWTRRERPGSQAISRRGFRVPKEEVALLFTGVDHSVGPSA
jgi:threonine synthase